MIYLDHNASAPLRPEAWRTMQPWLSASPGNPASAHSAGRRARKALEDAREQLAALLGAAPDEVVFTSGATEANNLALFGLAGEPPAHLISSRIEHPCVIGPLLQLERRGFAVDWTSVDAEGQVVPEQLSALLRTNTRVVAVMLANHETGAIQPVAELQQLLPAACAAQLHCDAAQAAGKVPIDFHQLGATTLSISGHKFGGPPGIGALLLNRSAQIRPLLYGGHQQRGRRPGTEPVALAVGLAAALDASLRQRESEMERMLVLRRRFLEVLQRLAGAIHLNGPSEGGLPHVLNLSFPGCRGDTLLMALDLDGVACSTGSACSSGSLQPSPVLQAMGLPEERLSSALRFSFGPTTTEAEIDEAARRLAAIVARMRATI